MDILNMPWILLVVISALLSALVNFVDNYISDVIFDGKYAQAEKMITGPMYALVGVIILAILQPSFDSVVPILLVVGSGVISSLSAIPYWMGLENEETTTVNIFEQLIPVFSLILAWIFLGQVVEFKQFVAFGAMFAAPIVVMASRGKRQKRASIKSAVVLVLYAMIYAVSTLLFVQGCEMVEWNFFTSMALMMIGVGCTDMLLLSGKKKWRKHFYAEVKKQKLKVFAVIILGNSIWMAADVIYHLAVTKTDVLALANVSAGTIEMIATFLFGVLFSVLWPSFGREKLTKRSVMAHLIATMIAVIGLILIE